MADLEGGINAYAFASGLAAADTVLSLLDTGDQVLAMDDLYGGSRRLFEKVRTRTSGLDFIFGDLSKPAILEKLISDKVKMIWVETPTNPLLKITDLNEISKIAIKNNLLFAVDSTFSTPVFLKPLDFGADLVMHSTTKFIRDSGKNPFFK